MLTDIVCYDYDGNVVWKTDVNTLNDFGNADLSDSSDSYDSSDSFADEEVTEPEEEIEVEAGESSDSDKIKSEENIENDITAEDTELNNSTSGYDSALVSGVVMDNGGKLFINVVQYSGITTKEVYYAVDMETGDIASTPITAEELNCALPVKSEEITDNDYAT